VPMSVPPENEKPATKSWSQILAKARVRRHPPGAALPLGILVIERFEARRGRLTGQGPGVRISRLQQWPPRRGRRRAAASSVATRSNAIPCLLQLNSSRSIDGGT
jgi:hypothetical protein